MKAKIISVHNHGDYDKEYVLIRVLEDCDIGNYILSDTTYTDEKTVSNKIRHTYWFLGKEVKKGDLVSVWTKQGKNTTTTNNEGTPVHRFYWGLRTAVWNDDGDAAILMVIAGLQHYKAKG